MKTRQRTTRTQRGTRPPRGRARPRTHGRQFERLVEIMRVLRSSRGCPWDRKQTLQTLSAFVLEEAYEVVAAIDTGDRVALRGEVGDLIFEGVFLAQICSEEDAFTIADALESVVDKLIRRHPHVFGSSPAADKTAVRHTRSELTAEQVLERWEQLKSIERSGAGERSGILAGVPKTLPALLRAYEIGNRVARVGFDWARASDVLQKVDEEVRELRRALETETHARGQEELGDMLFALANLARKLGIEPEAALRRANDKFTRRFEQLEARFHARGITLNDVTLDEMEREWQGIKNGT